jgi:tetratricopeptide (TPR) repeat protein
LRKSTILRNEPKSEAKDTSGTEKLGEAVVAFREALKEYTRERVPVEWAATQHNLGVTLTRLGRRESGTEKLEEATAAFRDALKERTRERVPLDWAATQDNLSDALQILGERERRIELARRSAMRNSVGP